jgi:hypothetical protein
MVGFNAISLKLKEMYQMITLGGDAELELVDSLDPFSEVWLTLDIEIITYVMHLVHNCLALTCFLVPVVVQTPA